MNRREPVNREIHKAIDVDDESWERSELSAFRAVETQLLYGHMLDPIDDLGECVDEVVGSLIPR